MRLPNLYWSARMVRHYAVADWISVFACMCILPRGAADSASPDHGPVGVCASDSHWDEVLRAVDDLICCAFGKRSRIHIAPGPRNQSPHKNRAHTRYCRDNPTR